MCKGLKKYPSVIGKGWELVRSFCLYSFVISETHTCAHTQINSKIKKLRNSLWPDFSRTLQVAELRRGGSFWPT